jgi:hypothetical protein
MQHPKDLSRAALVHYHKYYQAGGVAQVVEHLFSKCEALSSNPSATNKENLS